MDKKVIGILVAILVIIAVVVLCMALGNKKEEQPSSPVVVINESGEQEIKVSRNVETDPYNANIPNEIFDFYLEKVEEIEKKHKAEQTERLEEDPDIDLTSLTKLKYDLVFFDDNNVPEMVVTEEGYRTALYTYEPGKVIYAMRDEFDASGDELGWPFGAAGNQGYEFIPRANVLRNINSDQGGLIRYYAFYKLDDKEHNLVNHFDNALCEYHFDDLNKNGNIDEEEAELYTDNATAYFAGEKELTEDEAKAYVILGDYEPLEGTKTADEFRAILQSLVNEK